MEGGYQHRTALDTLIVASYLIDARNTNNRFPYCLDENRRASIDAKEKGEGEVTNGRYKRIEWVQQYNE
jgi:hypothetical protein